MLEKIIGVYALIGCIITMIGIYRTVTGKISIEPDELTVLTWFFFWPIYLFLLLRTWVMKIFTVLLLLFTINTSYSQNKTSINHSYTLIYRLVNNDLKLVNASEKKVFHVSKNKLIFDNTVYEIKSINFDKKDNTLTIRTQFDKEFILIKKDLYYRDMDRFYYIPLN